MERVAFCMDARGVNGLCKEMLDVIHVDEKWFRVDVVNMRVYMAEDEDLPNRTLSHKSHIRKVMFLATMGRPRWDPYSHSMRDEKIGIWPMVEWRAAARSSCNQLAGTMEPHNRVYTRCV